MKSFTRTFSTEKLQSALIGILILASLFSCSTNRRVKQDLSQSFIRSQVFQQNFTGFVVYDPEDDKIIYEKNSDKYFTPASNIKLLTFYAGLKILGDSVPAIKYSVRDDSLIFKGTGDPTFLHPEFSSPQVFEFLQEREEKLYFVPPVFEEERLGPGWSWDDYNWYFSAERGAFPVYGNVVNFRFQPFSNFPQVQPRFFKNELESDSTFSGARSGAKRHFSNNIFTIQHRTGNREREQNVPYRYSSELVAKLLSDTLQREVQLLKNISTSIDFENTLYSVPTDSLYKKMLRDSDNFIAEQVLLMAAGEIADSLKTSIAIEHILSNYLTDLADKPQWVDGSGLSRYNLITPRSMVQILKKIKEEVPVKKLFELLPAGGESGTLTHLYKAEEPYVYAKTGTLRNNHNLSGFLKTRSGRILIFSFMNNNFTVPTSVIQKEMEKILRNIHLKL